MKKPITCLAITLGAFALSTLDVNAVEVKPEEIANSTYVIGTHMFTREGSEYYDGVLTTDYIMLASQTINSDKLEDMTIYYKNPRGKWVDVLKNKNVEMTSELEITHKDNKVYMVTPTLRNDTLENWKDLFDGNIISLYEGAYGYDLAIDKSTYRIGEDYYEYNVTGYEIYEKTNEGYKLVEGHPMTGSEIVFVRVKPGEKKEYVSRVYATDSNGTKYYSNYSNTITIDHTKIETPTLRNDTIETFEAQQFGEEFKATLYEGAYGYDLAIAKVDYRVRDNYDDYTVTGYEIYEKTSAEYKLVEGYLMTGPEAFMIEVEPGEKKEYVSRVYATDYDGVKHYSDYSNVITIDHTEIEKPTLTVGSGSEDTALYLGFTVALEGYYGTERALSTIDGWELYEKTGDKYTVVETNDGTSEKYSIDVTLYAGETKTYVARTYALNKSGEKIYSEYSNEITESKTVETPTLTAAYGSPGFVGFTIYLEGHYMNKFSSQTIDGWELYEKVGNNYNLLEGNEVELNEGETRTFVARAYALNQNNQKVYSDYSNEIMQ